MADPTIASITPNHGPVLGNTEVTVTGTNFANPPGVQFGGIAGVDVKWKNDGEFSVKTPAQISDGPVVVSIGAAGQQPAHGAFTYVGRDPMGAQLAAIWFAYLGAALVVGAYVLAAMWPSPSDEVALFGIFKWEPPTDVRLLFIAGAAGVLGATAYGFIALARWLGKKADDEAWSGYYFARPFAGFAVAVIIYLVFRGGLVVLTVDGGAAEDSVEINVNSVAALGGLAGLMTMNALQILDQIFKSVFRFDGGSAQGLERENPTTQPTPPTDA